MKFRLYSTETGNYLKTIYGNTPEDAISKYYKKLEKAHDGNPTNFKKNFWHMVIPAEHIHIFDYNSWKKKHSDSEQSRNST